jgi:hypothetical protein
MFDLLVYIYEQSKLPIFSVLLWKKNKLSFATNKKGEMRLEGKSDKLMNGDIFFDSFSFGKESFNEKTKSFDCQRWASDCDQCFA